MNKLTIVLAALAASQLGATNCGQITRDPGFDLWCGDHLCAWKIERGSVLRVPTWNEGDPGVQLVGDDVAIEQLTPVESGDGACIEFHLIANVALDAQVTLNVDVDGDGTIEKTEQIPTAAWQPFSYLIAIAPPYAGVRFEIAKQGSGEAVLAQIEAKLSQDCGSIPTIDPRPAPLGSPCFFDGDCASGLCANTNLPVPFGVGVDKICTGCSPTSCGSGDVCGAAAPVGAVRGVPDACVASASKVLGEMCQTDAECASGICTGACSTCDLNHPCANGATCGELVPRPFAPSVCDPGAHLRVSGEPCVIDADCVSGSTCAGTPALRCDDGRACGNDLDCPFEAPPDGGSLINGSCTVVGIAGGSCT